MEFCIYNPQGAREVVYVGLLMVDPQTPLEDREHIAWLDFFRAIDFEFKTLQFNPSPKEMKFKNVQTKLVADWILETGMQKLKNSEVLWVLKENYSGDILHYELASWISHWIREANPLANQDSIYSEILAIGLDDVDYLELAELVLNS